MFDKVLALSPLSFFQLEIEIKPWEKKFPSKEFLLPDTSCYLGLESFAKVYAAHRKDGLIFFVAGEVETCELFLDTKDIKSKSGSHQFFHHFMCSEEGGLEVTRFRGENSHPLCNPRDIEVKFKPKSMQIFLPQICLYGYDPRYFDRVGFTYKILHKAGYVQDFSLSSEEYKIEHHPELWASCKLQK